jgi:hypothetical protein
VCEAPFETFDLLAAIAAIVRFIKH